ncbi:hypothetical protein PFICI_10200 [Pestalotiopsis fici W106-1]|uniref:Rhodopsin domain-containing protein n=1 Tax=Pestalotiopsis fici (strain W106-1 / CGMCC3.15140) TaxID=1229662 RepID=W3WW84_PESFW|nr:uncharacterized protein PFICI_10200 [Pestalotiopsis fici W106-1]ETS78138.1 hypothetical protein PFICI_10200 [Pestalotiopsis fici W106-1]
MATSPFSWSGTGLSPEEQLAQVPSAFPPDGVTPNFIDPATTGPAARVIIGLSLGLMYILLCLRLYTRIVATSAFGADDLLCLMSAATNTAYCGVVLSALGSPLGPHQWDVPLIKQTEHFLNKAFVFVCLYALAAMFLKSAFLVLYLRLFGPSRAARILIWVSLVCINLFYLLIIIIDSAKCGSALRNGVIPTIDPENFSLLEYLGRFQQIQTSSGCAYPQIVLSAAMSLVSVITDFYVLAIPIGLILTIKLPTQRKIGVSAIFLTGLIACVFSIASTVYRFQLLHSDDFNWIITIALSLTMSNDQARNRSAAEINIGICCCCMPVCYVVVHRLATDFRSSWASLVRLASSGRRGQSTKEVSGQFGRSVSNDSPYQQPLPTVPRGTITGLRSFVQNVYRSRPEPMSELQSYNDLISVDENYHGRPT